MTELCRSYRDYLQQTCRYDQDSVDACTALLPTVIADLNVSSPEELNVAKITHAWRNRKWRTTVDGIQLSEDDNFEYILTLKALVQYFENNGHNLQKGLSQLVTLPRNQSPGFGGLTEAEQGLVREHCLFELSTDTKRRNVALLYLLLSIDCSLEDILSLQTPPVEQNDLPTESSSSDAGFFQHDGQVLIKLPGKRGHTKSYPIPYETWLFVKLYVESRSISSNNLFIRGSGKNADATITKTVALNALAKLVVLAGISIDKDLLEQVLVKTNFVDSTTIAHQSLEQQSTEQQPTNQTDPATDAIQPPEFKLAEGTIGKPKAA